MLKIINHLRIFLCSILTILFVFISSSSKAGNRVNSFQSQNNTDTIKVLFIGTCLLSLNNFSGVLSNFCTAGDKNIYADYFIRTGTPLDIIVDLNSAHEKINELNWTYIVLQGNIFNNAYPETHHLINPGWGYHPLRPACEKVIDIASANYAETKIIFLMPYAYEDGIRWIPGYRDSYEDMQLKIYDNAIEMGNELGMIVAPLGAAWQEIYQNHKEIDLFQPDFTHPTKAGTYLIASVFYSTFFNESSRGIEYFGGISEYSAAQLQNTASDIVLNNPELWNLITSTNADLPFIAKDYELYQNYPNPFNPTTNIRFSLAHSGYVNVSLFDSNGQQAATIIDEFKNSGHHTISFNCTGLASGVYFYQLRINNYSDAKKMILLK